MFVLVSFAIILGIIAVPFAGFFIGWGLGWILNLIMGSWIIDGLNLFGLNVAPQMIPLFFAMIGLVASFFAANNLIKNIEIEREEE